MRKSKQGGIAIEEVVGILIVMIIAIILVFLFNYINYIHQSNVDESVSVSFGELQADYNLLYFLKEPLDNLITADEIGRAYLQNDYGKMANLPNNFFRNIYGTYDAIIGGKNINNIHFTGKPISSSISMPLENKNIISVELYVGQEGVILP